MTGSTAEPPASAAVVVIGGGILGAVTLWELAREGVSCVLLEAAEFAAESTGKSAAIVRAHYSNPQVVRMAVHSRRALGELPQLLGCDPVYHRTGWLFLIDEHDRDNAIANREMQLEQGSTSAEVEVDELERYVPGVRTEGIAYALYEEDSGFADPVATTNAYLAAARELGAGAFDGVDAQEIVIRARRVQGVRVNGRVVACDTVVLAAGAWSVRLARAAGVELPIRVTREQDVIYETAPSPPPALAVSAQVDRIYLRPLIEEAASLLLVGRGFPKPYDYVEPDGYVREVDEQFEHDVRARLRHRFPMLNGIRERGGRVGLYTVTPDWHPLLGPVDELQGLHLATGGSGHCFKLAPAIGEMVAARILGTGVDYADIHDFRLSRFHEGETFGSTYGGNRA